MFAVNGVRIVEDEAAGFAFLTDLGRAKEDLEEAQEQRHAKDHHADRQHTAPRTRQSNVAKARRGQRRHREIERVGVVADLWVHVDLGRVDETRHDKEEHAEVQGGEDDIFVLAEEAEVLTKSAKQLICMQQTECSQNAEEADAFACDRREEGQNRGDIGPCREAEHHFTFVFLDPNSNQKVGQDEDAKDRIDDFDRRCVFVEGRSNHKEDRHNIKGEDTVAKPMRGKGVVFVEGTDFFHVVGPKEKTRPVGAGQID